MKIELESPSENLGPGEFWLCMIPEWKQPKVCVTLENLPESKFICGTEEHGLTRFRVIMLSDLICRVDIPTSLGWLQEIALKNKAIITSKAVLGDDAT